MPSVFRAPFPGVSMTHAPDRESVSAAVGDVEIAGILQRDAVQGEIVAARKHHQARAILASAGPSLLREVPPGDVLPDELGPAAAIDDAIAHHRRAGDIAAVDQGPAAASALAHDAATARTDLVYPRVSRSEQDGLGIHPQRDAGPQIERAGEKGVVRAIGLQLDG